MSNTITPTVFYRTLNMEGLEIFYREAGPRAVHYGCNANAIPPLAFRGIQFSWRSLAYSLISPRRCFIPSYPIFLTQVLHASGSVVDVVEGIAEATQNVVQGFSGWLSDKFLDRFGAGFRSAPRDALIASSVSDEYRGRAFGLEGIGDNPGAFLD